MNYATFSSWGPGTTPVTIKRLIIATCVLTLLTVTLQALFDYFNLFPGPHIVLSLSSWGLKKWFIWEPLTFLFIQDATHGLSLSFLITLFFNMYLLWVIGTPVLELIGNGPFLRLYFISGIAAGLLTILCASLFGQYAMLAGATPSILAVLTVWSLAFPEAEILLFFLIPIKAKWLVLGIVGLVLLTAITQFDFAYFFLYLFAVAIGYGYATIAWGWHSPFPHTQRFDSLMATLGLRLRSYLPHWKRRSNIRQEAKDKDKIVDINTGTRIVDDDAFVDAMLAKISKYGEEALSWSEKQRLQKISEKRKK